MKKFKAKYPDYSDHYYLVNEDRPNNIEKKFDSCLKGMKSGKYDVLALTSKKPERTKYMDYYFSKSNKKRSLVFSKKSPFSKFSKEIQKSVDLGL